MNVNFNPTAVGQGSCRAQTSASITAPQERRPTANTRPTLLPLLGERGGVRADHSTQTRVEQSSGRADCNSTSELFLITAPRERRPTTRTHRRKNTLISVALLLAVLSVPCL